SADDLCSKTLFPLFRLLRQTSSVCRTLHRIPRPGIRTIGTGRYLSSPAVL
ncbi:hypothetical protein M378DRAFT_165312, partial [Amanita muscaria Koide BX008]